MKFLEPSAVMFLKILVHYNFGDKDLQNLALKTVSLWSSLAEQANHFQTFWRVFHATLWLNRPWYFVKTGLWYLQVSFSNLERLFVSLLLWEWISWLNLVPFQFVFAVFLCPLPFPVVWHETSHFSRWNVQYFALGQYLIVSKQTSLTLEYFLPLNLHTSAKTLGHLD